MSEAFSADDSRHIETYNEIIMNFEKEHPSSPKYCELFESPSFENESDLRFELFFNNAAFYARENTVSDENDVKSNVIEVSDEEVGICGGSITLDNRSDSASLKIRDSWTRLTPPPWIRPNVRLKETDLRPVVIDGSNVSFKDGTYCGRRLEICIREFQNAQHRVTAFMPQFRTMHTLTRNAEILDRLALEGVLVLTPSRSVDGRMVTPYDDRYIVEYAEYTGAVIVSRDGFRDLLKENPNWKSTIRRSLKFKWVEDRIFFPKHPSSGGRTSLREFLRF